MKKIMMRIAVIAMAAALLLTVPALLGCSASSNESSYDMAVTESFDEPMYNYDIGYSDGALTDTAVEETASAGGESEIERKIIRNADVEIEADDANACYSAIIANIKTYGGYESNFNARNSDYSSGTYVYIEAELRMPPEKLEEFIAEIKTGDYGEVTYCAVTSDEVTEEYYDLATRLESKERALDSYYALLEKAETIDDVLSIQSRIDNLTEEIESIKGRLRLYDSLVDESTIYLNITQYTEKPVEEKEFEWDSLTGSDFLKLIKNGFLGVCNFVWSALQWIVIILISISPLLLIVGAVFFIVRAIRKRHPKNKPSKSASAAVPGGDNTTEVPDYK